MKKKQDANLEPNGDRNKSDCLYCCRDWSNNSLISLDLHIMQLTDCFNVYRTHLQGIAETKDKLQGIFDLHAYMYEGLDGGGGGVWYSLYTKNLVYYSSH